MEESYLIDSNVLIDYTGGQFKDVSERRLDDIFDHGFYYSISRMEVLGYNNTPEILQSLEGFLSTGTMLYVTDDVSDQAILIRRTSPKTKLPDAIIAATALVHSKTFLTRNTADFKDIQGIHIYNPWEW